MPIKEERNMKIQQLTVGPVATNCYLVADEKTKKAAVIDPAANAEGILDMIDKSGFIVEKILLTHGHFDHMAALDAVAIKTGAEIFIAHEDLELLRDANKNAAMLFFGEDTHSDLPVTEVKNGDNIPLGNLEFTVQHTPGHTKGSVCYFAEKACFTGDTIFAEGFGRTDLYGGDYARLRVSLMELVPHLKGKKIYPGHGSTRKF